MPIHVTRKTDSGDLTFDDYYTNAFVIPTKANGILSVVFNNAKGEEKRSGATTVLEIKQDYDVSLEQLKEIRVLTKNQKIKRVKR